MANIIGLDNKRIFNKPSDSVIKVLEDLLEKARNGDIKSLITISFYNNKDVTKDIILEDNINTYMVYGIITSLQSDYYEVFLKADTE